MTTQEAVAMEVGELLVNVADASQDAEMQHGTDRVLPPPTVPTLHMRAAKAQQHMVPLGDMWVVWQGGGATARKF